MIEISLFAWTCIVLAICIASAGYYVRSRGLARVITTLVRLFLSRIIKSFQLSHFSVYPFVMLDFEITLRGSRKQPEATVSFKSFKILFTPRNLLVLLFEPLGLVSETNEATMSSHRIVLFELTDFHAASPNIRFADLINPPENKPPTVIPIPNILPNNTNKMALFAQRIVQYLLQLIEIKFISFHFELTMPIHRNIIEGFATEMCITFPMKCLVNPESIHCKVTVTGGVAEITQSNKKCLLYSGKFGIMRIEMHPPTGMYMYTMFSVDDVRCVHC